MDYGIAETRKITNQTFGTNDKIVMFKWTAKRIDKYGEHDRWVAGGISDSQ